MTVGLGRRCRALALVVWVGLLSQCVTPEMQAVGRLNPQPMVTIPRRRVMLSLDVSRLVADEFRVPENNGITEVPVSSFRDSIAAGFWAGPATSFATRGAPRYVLSIYSCELDFVPSTIAVMRSFTTFVVAARARVRYMARVRNPDGDVVASARGEVLSTVVWNEVGGAGRATEDALAKMWVDLSESLLATFPIAVPEQQPPQSSGGEQPGLGLDGQPASQRRVQTW
ncbi:MAG: hypothetical protein JNK05_03355 [Myxococcales bacterium]|nr:hypothetical protein [Myxococcales bacterium]